MQCSAVLQRGGCMAQGLHGSEKGMLRHCTPVASGMWCGSLTCNDWQGDPALLIHLAAQEGVPAQVLHSKVVLHLGAHSSQQLQTRSSITISAPSRFEEVCRAIAF